MQCRNGAGLKEVRHDQRQGLSCLRRDCRRTELNAAPLQANIRSAMKLIIVHYHWRPGGVRRVIEMATPHLVHGSRRGIDIVTFASGEPADRTWVRLMESQLSDTAVEWLVEPAFGYISEQTQSPS